MSPSGRRGGGAGDPHHRIRARDAGMFTAEFAVGLVAVLPVMFALVTLTALVAGQVKLAEAARTGARVLARGESHLAAQRQIVAIVPGTEVDIDRAEGLVEVQVRRRVSAPGPLPDLTLRARAVTPDEVTDGW